jgi:hypothetical protein
MCGCREKRVQTKEKYKLQLHMAGLYAGSISATVTTNGYDNAVSKITFQRSTSRADFTPVNLEHLKLGSGS